MAEAGAKTSTSLPFRALALGSVLLAALLFFLPLERLGLVGPDGRGAFKYLAFAATLLLLPSLLVRREGRWLRPIILVACMVLFGFLRWACPRAVGAFEETVLQLSGAAESTTWAAPLFKVFLLLAGALVFGRYYCGWLCPIGTLQDILYRPRLGFRVPGRLDRALKWGKYLMAFLMVASPLLFQYRLMRQVEPFKIVFRFGDGVEDRPVTQLESVSQYFDGVQKERFSPDGQPQPSVTPYLMGFLVFLVVLSVFVERPYCRYLSPVGGVLALAAQVAPGRMRVHSGACSACGRCEKVCPMQAIELKKQEGAAGKPAITRSECIVCKECEAICPETCVAFAPGREQRPPQAG